MGMSYKDGVQCKVSCNASQAFPRVINKQITGSCTARPDNLDGPSFRRTSEHTEALVAAFDLQDLWDEFGVVGDIVVCFR